MVKKNPAKKATGKDLKRSGKPARTAKAKLGGTNALMEKAKKLPKDAAKIEKTFKLKAPHAEQVSLVGYFNEWDPMANALECDGDGMWTCTLSFEPGEYEYRFVVDGQWCDDPANLLRRSNGFGTENCILIV